MNPARVDRQQLGRLTDLPNIGPAMARDLVLLGIEQPEQLVGRCPYALYRALCQKTGQRHDPCVIDVLISVTHFMAGGAPRSWWSYTDERKQAVAQDPGLVRVNED